MCLCWSFNHGQLNAQKLPNARQKSNKIASITSHFINMKSKHPIDCSRCVETSNCIEWKRPALDAKENQKNDTCLSTNPSTHRVSQNKFKQQCPSIHQWVYQEHAQFLTTHQMTFFTHHLLQMNHQCHWIILLFECMDDLVCLECSFRITVQICFFLIHDCFVSMLSFSTIGQINQILSSSLNFLWCWLLLWWGMNMVQKSFLTLGSSFPLNSLAISRIWQECS